MKTVIMAGGKGTRISSVASDIPKPMIKIEGKPVLEREIECLREQGFTDLIITVSHLAECIMDYFGDGSGLGVNIDYFVEEKPLGNAGALFKLKDKLDGDFLLLNADSVFNIDFNRFVEYHKSKGGLVTLFTHPNSHPYDSGLLIADGNGAVMQWLTKEDARPQWYSNRVNAGLHVINSTLLDMISSECEVASNLETENKEAENLNDGFNLSLNHIVVWRDMRYNAHYEKYCKETNIIPNLIRTIDQDGKVIKVDLDRQILKPLCGTGLMFCYDSPEYVKDMGTPDRYDAVCQEYKAGIVEAKNLKNKQKAIFIDRDGTINKYVGFLRDINDFELLPSVAEAVRKINASGYLAIVVTNQPVIARGEVTYEQLQEIHNKMETLLGTEGAYLDAIYYCPHHPHKGYEGEIPELKIECECRKPKPGMLLKAAEDFNIDLSSSWMIGDGENDIKAGIAAGCRTALINSNGYRQDNGNGLENGFDCENDYGQDMTVSSLLEFVRIICTH